MNTRRMSLIASLLLTVALGTTAPAVAQETFPTPEAASKALVAAAGSLEVGVLQHLFGPGATELLATGDENIDRRHREELVAAAAKSSTVVDGTDGHKVLVFGEQGWRFPIPLLMKDGSWSFDVAAGRQELTDRVIGRNEITAIDACADFVAAQTEYFATLHDDQPVQQYARKFISTPGLHDGLYWAPATASDRSPLGDRVAAAAFETAGKSGKPVPYYGYIYRILTQQGPDAPGGAYSYLTRNRLLGGFAMLAYPETWKETGVMSFLCDQRGQVYQANLGPTTSAIAGGLTVFNPGPGWETVGN